MNGNKIEVLLITSANKLKFVSFSTTFTFSGVNISLFQTVQNLGAIIDALLSIKFYINAIWKFIFEIRKISHIKAC